jgi:hypothetical protein
VCLVGLLCSVAALHGRQHAQVKVLAWIGVVVNVAPLLFWTGLAIQPWLVFSRDWFLLVVVGGPVATGLTLLVLHLRRTTRLAASR